MPYRGDNFLTGGLDYGAAEGGPHCISFRTPEQRLVETAVFGLLGLAGIVQFWRPVRLDVNKVIAPPVREYQIRHCLLVLLALIYGLELGFKLSKGKVLLMLNPCHVLTLTQLFLLASPCTRFTNTLFRLHVYWLTGETKKENPPHTELTYNSPQVPSWPSSSP